MKAWIYSAQMQEYAGELALEDIAPTWNSRLRQLPVSGLKRILWHCQMASPETCIVGEAYGLSSAYVNDCARCAAFSQAFLDAFRNNSRDALYGSARHFMAHWNGEHKGVTARVDSKVRRKLRWYDAFIRTDDHVLTYRGR